MKKGKPIGVKDLKCKENIILFNFDKIYMDINKCLSLDLICLPFCTSHFQQNKEEIFRVIKTKKVNFFCLCLLNVTVEIDSE